ncbi:MAG: 4'-phosphopantetheinyl transferase superfamily protein [Saprospiraceae bacterium]
MPLLLHENLPFCGELGLWQIAEEEAYFQQKMPLTVREQTELAAIKGEKRRLEWWSGRYLLHQMSGRSQRGECYKDQFGKPYLDASPFAISISHSHGIAAVVAAPISVGIDIQKKVEKIERIAHKFMRPEETASLEAATRLEQLHVYWGAKEALYKAYGRRQLDFKAHISIEPFELEEYGDTLQGKVQKGDYQSDFQLWYRLLEDYVLVYAMELEQ